MQAVQDNDKTQLNKTHINNMYVFIMLIVSLILLNDFEIYGWSITVLGAQYVINTFTTF